jgi:hypothetical protein
VASSSLAHRSLTTLQTIFLCASPARYGASLITSVLQSGSKAELLLNLTPQKVGENTEELPLECDNEEKNNFVANPTSDEPSDKQKIQRLNLVKNPY